MKTQFSLIIPTLNEENYLSHLLSDLRNQTYPYFDVFVIDAQSQDKTPHVAKSFSQDMKLTFLQAKEKGIAAQRNYGAQKSSAPYLFFIDADSRIEPAALENTLKNIEKYKHLVYLPVHIPQEAHIDDLAMQSTINFLTEISQVTSKPFSYGPSMIFERHFFSFLGGFHEDVTFFEDHEIVQRTRKSGVIPKLLRDVSVRFSMRRFREEGRFTVLQKYLIATTHMYLKGKITDNLFEYEWGGSRYGLKEKDNKLEQQIKKYIEKMRSYIQNIVEKHDLI